MTEEEWLNGTDQEYLLEYLAKAASPRKRRLYLCAGCRCIAHLFFDPVSLEAVDVAERFADGEASDEELGTMRWRAECPTFGYEFEEEDTSNEFAPKHMFSARLVELGAIPEVALHGGAWQCDFAIRTRLLAAASLAKACAGNRGWYFRYTDIPQVDWPGRWLLDCVFGNPFRPTVIDSGWLHGNGGAVSKIALAIYQKRMFDLLPILADALEEAGCTDTAILAHCRGPGPHVRGCWAIDLLLGKS